MKAAGRELTDAEALEDDRRHAALAALDVQIAELEAEDRRELDESAARTARIGHGTSLSGLRIELPTGSIRRPRLLGPSIEAARFANVFGHAPAADAHFGNLETFLAPIAQGVFHPGLQAPSAAAGSMFKTGDAGYLVPVQLVAEMFDAALEGEIVRPRCVVRAMSSDTLRFAGFSHTDASEGIFGFTAVWTEEGGQLTSQAGSVKPRLLHAKKLGIYCVSSNELIADGQSYEEQLGRALVAGIAHGLDRAALIGTGAGQPLGVLNSASRIVIDPQVGSPVDTTITYGHCVEMLSRLHPNCVPRSAWLAHSTTIPSLLTLSVPIGDGGTHVPAMIEKNVSFSLLTRPVLFTEKVRPLGQEGDFSLVDLSQYVLGIRADVSLAKSSHIGFDTDTTGYRILLRADGQATWETAYQPPNSAPTQSWCVVLGARG